MTKTRLNQALISEADKADLEKFAQEDGWQRGFFFTTAGKCKIEIVRTTAHYPYLFKTKAGKPYAWNT